MKLNINIDIPIVRDIGNSVKQNMKLLLQSKTTDLVKVGVFILLIFAGVILIWRHF